MSHSPLGHPADRMWSKSKASLIWRQSPCLDTRTANGRSSGIRVDLRRDPQSRDRRLDRMGGTARHCGRAPRRYPVGEVVSLFLPRPFVRGITRRHDHVARRDRSPDRGRTSSAKCEAG